MRTIDQYLDAARSAGELPSDRQLSMAVGVNPGAVNEYRTKRAWPDDATMLKIAELAKLPTDQALIDLNIWRSKNSDVIALYRKIATAVAAACFAFLLLAPNTGTAAEQSHPQNLKTIHYATLFMS